MKQLSFLTGALLVLGWCGAAQAAVSADEAKQLGAKLTPFGAEAAGNADGSIPAYGGGYKPAIPADFKPGSGRYSDPFKGEKPLYTIDAKNMAQHADLLAPGTKALLQRFPTYKVNVYKTYRTMQYPESVLKNTLKNATTAKMVGEEPGDGVEATIGGLPFPIPKNGLEAIWNQVLRYQGPRTDFRHQITFVDRNGRSTMVGDQETQFMWYWYDPKATALPDWSFYAGFTTFYGPPAQAGQLFLQKFTINNSDRDDTTWIYTPGQRRVRVAPELKYDTPTASVGGVMTYDEIGGFNGRRDRFDFKIVGKKEMLIPYNNFRAFYDPELIGTQHENPEAIRWEKHRVWVVEATLKPGKRHIYSKRTYYLDEDSWSISLYEAYDQSGQLYRVSNTFIFVPYDKPRLGQPANAIYDLTKGSWAVTGWNADPKTHMIPYDEVPPASRFTPETLGAAGVR